MKLVNKIVICTLLCIVLLFAAIGSYTVISFHNGKKAAQSQVNPTKNKDFSGDQQTNMKEITIMLIGDDGREDDEDGGRADTLMVAHYNSETKQPKLVSIMRDSYVKIPEYGLEKINAAYAFGGAELTRKVLNDSFGLPINYYISADFNNFIRLINELYPKGIEIDAEKDINLDNVDIKKGIQVMDGNTLLQYARFRMDEEGDFGRVRRQQQVMDALAKQSKNAVSFLQLPKIAGEAVGYLDTNIPADVLVDLAKDFLTGKVKNLQTLSIPVSGSWAFNDYTEAGSVLEIDEEQNQLAIHDFLNDGAKR
ncbi:transcriptional regulator [Enterococcus ureilyticus]|uniref:Regulatory protein MsrR n=1 Tax=Enterococcus ureilyticus TaxID=1131292 RepID=A0A1E5HGU4_9ENTE|nr:LCP family protein [Enterococcus ureilyticus]MBM7688094.1 LCP family protein required for cell wall assembly [Enterococcus ureilyticus]MBO0446838.1 LCP family protein [Enterococcus ureilyticus]OEG23840.1 transcriptional regulator [Enterococcus ureilyticus]